MRRVGSWAARSLSRNRRLILAPLWRRDRLRGPRSAITSRPELCFSCLGSGRSDGTGWRPLAASRAALPVECREFSFRLQGWKCLRPSCRRVAGRPSQGRRADVSWSAHERVESARLDDLTRVIFVTTGGMQTSYSAGNTASTPFFFSKTTTNFAGFVVLALRPTVCTSLGPS
jgi:hypothetical protein